MIRAAKKYKGDDFYNEKIKDEEVLSLYLSKYFNSLNNTVLDFGGKGLIYDSDKFNLKENGKYYDKLEIILSLWNLRMWTKYNGYLFNKTMIPYDIKIYYQENKNESINLLLNSMVDRSVNVYTEIKDTIKERIMFSFHKFFEGADEIYLNQIENPVMNRFIGSYSLHLVNSILKKKKEGFEYEDSISITLNEESDRLKDDIFSKNKVEYGDSLYGYSIPGDYEEENKEILIDHLDSSRNKAIGAISVTETQTYVDESQNNDFNIISGIVLIKGMKIFKTWNAVGDHRTRPAHMSANGQEVGIFDRFIVGGEELESPRDSSGSPMNTVNCRCWTTFNLKVNPI